MEENKDVQKKENILDEEKEFEKRQIYLNSLTNTYINSKRISNKDAIQEEVNQGIQNRKNSGNYKSGFTILAHILCLLSIVELVILIILADISISFTITLSNIISISVLYGLGNARTRLNILEDDVIELKKQNKVLTKKINNLTKHDEDKK